MLIYHVMGNQSNLCPVSLSACSLSHCPNHILVHNLCFVAFHKYLCVEVFRYFYLLGNQSRYVIGHIQVKCFDRHRKQLAFSGMLINEFYYFCF